jgi:hypothetical protein
MNRRVYTVVLGYAMKALNDIKAGTLPKSVTYLTNYKLPTLSTSSSNTRIKVWESQGVLLTGAYALP